MMTISFHCLHYVRYVYNSRYRFLNTKKKRKKTMDYFLISHSETNQLSLSSTLYNTDSCRSLRQESKQ